jgi:outer membrane protein OmpA-like peptidoglycan-associated protein
MSGWGLQGYLQPAVVFWSSGRNTLSFIGQGGVGQTWSTVPGLAGTSASFQGGLQYSFDVVKNRFQIVGAITGGYTGPVDDFMRGNSFVGIQIALQPVIPLLRYPGSGAAPGPAGPRASDAQPPTPPPARPAPRPAPAPAPTPAPTPVPPSPSVPAAAPLPVAHEVFFQLDRPRAGEPASELGTLTPLGLANLAELRSILAADPTLKAQLVGTASIEGDSEYNYRLGQRRAEWLAAQLGLSAGRLDEPPAEELRKECRIVGRGLRTCGASGASRPAAAGDRRVLVRFFRAQ